MTLHLPADPTKRRALCGRAVYPSQVADEAAARNYVQYGRVHPEAGGQPNMKMCQKCMARSGTGERAGR